MDVARGFQSVVTTSEVFQSYEEDYHRLIERLRALAAVVEGGAVAERGAAGSEMLEAHERAKQAFQQMEFEVKSMGPLGAALSGKLKEYKQEMLACRTLVRNVQARLQREGLLGQAPRDEEKAERDSANRLRAGARRLEDSRRTALEAEAIGLNVMSELHDQRDSLKRTKGHLNDVDGHLGTSKMFLNLMSRRVQGNQAMVWCLAIVLFITLVFVIYLKLQKLTAFLR
ncbi:unnamed protein product [Effrenium voratum]|uniref:Vesicle transport v-SNARE N-terminal domain-containing protein n=1 Tax=Effrenium voratum TaxID=2562239 RepID=A0AA36NBK4_9DINO|nr:unnamed protein product [Effrenium voratum]CAJ1397416.1 unnamed protein product [Effrenium voratum]CAJ1429790.1 unnamed protein product [Effrenium voratum]|mmetsp:Transcript_68013/g.162350  ORF Transcript_68013/g.162350 Transcript_68013/m.162350 type:complete len:228 (+) Transcript_68013:62-745(+)